MHERFHKSLFLRFQLTIFHHWFVKWGIYAWTITESWRCNVYNKNLFGLTFSIHRHFRCRSIIQTYRFMLVIFFSFSKLYAQCWLLISEVLVHFTWEQFHSECPRYCSPSGDSTAGGIPARGGWRQSLVFTALKNWVSQFWKSNTIKANARRFTVVLAITERWHTTFRHVRYIWFGESLQKHAKIHCQSPSRGLGNQQWSH